MGKRTGPSAANTVKKNLSMLFNIAIKHEFGITQNRAAGLPAASEDGCVTSRPCGNGLAKAQGGAHRLYRRGKTHVGADRPILDALQIELEEVRHNQRLFLTHGKDCKAYRPKTLGNWFRRQCEAVGVPGSLHGLRKAGTSLLADAGASPNEIRAFLAHATKKEASTYTKKADRARLADSRLAKLACAMGERNLSNFKQKLETHPHLLF